jgi:hypothetical protein
MHRNRHDPYQDGDQQQAEHGRLDDADFDVVLGRDVVGELFDRRIQQFDREQDKQRADHIHIPGRARREEKAEQNHQPSVIIS